MSVQPSILVGTDGGTVLVRVEGKGTFMTSTGLKEFAREMTARGFRKFLVDLRMCPVMDSTFMGTLAGIALKLSETADSSVRIVNANERCRDLLANLGLDQLMTVDAAAAAQVEKAAQRLAPDADKDATTRTMLEAHESVAKFNPQAGAQFQDVIEYLRKTLKIVKQA